MKRKRFAVIAATLTLLGRWGAAQAADTYQVDPVHSFAGFSVGHLGIGLVRGFFSDISGTIVIDGQDAAKSSIEITIRTASVNTHVDKRDEDLRSPNFFAVEQYPTMTFKSTGIARAEKGYAVTGDLSLHGVTKRITVEAKHLGSGQDPWGGYRAGFAADFAIRRSDFGMKHDSPLIPDKVEISVAFEAVRQ